MPDYDAILKGEYMRTTSLLRLCYLCAFGITLMFVNIHVASAEEESDSFEEAIEEGLSEDSTEEGAAEEGGGTAIPGYVSGTNEAGAQGSGEGEAGEDGYVLMTGTKLIAGSATIVSNAFAAGTVPTTSRIVVFEENVDTPTLNTDIIASVSRDGGTTFTNATLADSGYVTGASGQRILTGQVTISGQPSGQSMRWKLALANNQVKIHGVSLSWA